MAGSTMTSKKMLLMGKRGSGSIVGAAARLSRFRLRFRLNSGCRQLYAHTVPAVERLQAGVTATSA